MWDRDAACDRDEIATLLKRLTQTERDVLVSFHSQGMSVAAIALALYDGVWTIRSKAMFCRVKYSERFMAWLHL